MFPTAHDEAIDNDPKNYELAKERPDQLKKIIVYLYTRLRKETRGVRPAGRKIPSPVFTPDRAHPSTASHLDRTKRLTEKDQCTTPIALSSICRPPPRSLESVKEEEGRGS
jgi:hypothetical protein